MSESADVVTTYVIHLPNDTIEERILGHVATLDVLTEQARQLLPSALGDDIADALCDLRAYIEEFVAAELDELRNRAAWFAFGQPESLPPPGPPNILVRTPNLSPPPKDCLDQ